LRKTGTPIQCALLNFSVFSVRLTQEGRLQQPVHAEISPIFRDDTPMILYMKRHIFRVVTRGPEGEYRIRDYVSEEEICRRHVQTGVSDYSIDVTVRGRPVFKGLIGPMPEVGGVLRYESPDVFEQMTKDWSESKRRHRRKKRARARA
jgi:hypothetical protein